MKRVAVTLLSLAGLFFNYVYADDIADQGRLDQMQSQLNQLREKLGDVKYNVVDANASYSRKLRAFTNRFFATDRQDGFLFALLPSTTFELALLEKQSLYAADRVVLGGYFEFDAQAWRSSEQFRTAAASNLGTGSQLAATSAKIDTLFNVNDWVHGVTRVSMNNMATGSLDIASGFIIFGNLARSPLFMVAGKHYLPFGVFGGGGPWAGSLTKSAFRPSELGHVAFGYKHDKLNTNIAIFQNTTHSTFGNFTYSLYYNDDEGRFPFSLGAGYLHDIRGYGQYGQAFTDASPATLKANRVPLFDVNGYLKYRDFKISGEYVTALRDASVGVAKSGLTTENQLLGRARSWYVSGQYTMDLWHQATTASVSLSRTTNMRGVPLALSGAMMDGYTSYHGLQSQWIGAISRQVLEDVYISVEYDRQKTYDDKLAHVYTLDASVYF